MTARLVAGAILFYQGAWSVWLGGHCRFAPSCSAYALEAVRCYGSMRGLWLGAKRILRCHPFSGGGYDPLPCQDNV